VESVDVIVVDDCGGASSGGDGFDDPSSGLPGSAVRPLPKSRKAFLDKIRARTLSGNFPTSSSSSIGTGSGVYAVASTTDKPSLERGHSCPTTLPARRISPDTASKHLSKTGRQLASMTLHFKIKQLITVIWNFLQSRFCIR